MKYLLFILPLALFSCAKPEISIESDATSAGSQPVGVLEFGKAHAGSTVGISLGETLGESAYCAATVLSNGLVATSSDCLQDEKNTYDVKEMRFHLRAPNSGTTKHYTVKAVESVDPQRNLAYLSLQEVPEVVVRTSIPSRWNGSAVQGTDASVSPSVSGTAFAVPDPDKKGVVRIQVTAVRVETAPVIVPVPASDKAAVAAADTDGDPAPASPTGPTSAVAESPFAHPRAVSIVGMKGGSRGSPVFVDGQLVSILRGDVGGRNNGHWLVGPAATATP